MYVLNLATTQNNYADAVSMVCPQSQALSVQVSNAAVYYQLQIASRGVAPGGEAWSNEAILQPGFHTFNQIVDFRGNLCNGIRFRSAVANVPAIVSASA